METKEFLSRVVAPGGYVCIVYVIEPRGKKIWVTRFFKGDDLNSAAGLLQWASSKGFDAYHAQASFRVANVLTDKRGQTYLGGSREAPNTVNLRSFWVDLDVARPGDGKPPATTFPSQLEAAQWLSGFVAAAGLPKPNVLVSSGYGVHAYWVMDAFLPTARWLPYAEAFKSALLAHGFKGDRGITGDPSRVLRPPGTGNHKTPIPAPVALLGAARPDIAHDVMLGALKPWLSAAPPIGGLGGGGSPQGNARPTSSSLSGGTVSQLFAQAVGGLNMSAAAQANIGPHRRPRRADLIVTRCEQMKKSLAEGGASDSRSLWYTGNLSVLDYCDDGAAYVHPISRAYPSYSAAETDKAAAQIAREHASKERLGFPSCAKFNEYRADVCSGCAFVGEVVSPLELGADDVTCDLPPGYRQTEVGLERRVEDEKGSHWVRIVVGAFDNPVLDYALPAGFALSYTYSIASHRHEAHVQLIDLGTEAGTIFKIFQRVGLVLQPNTEVRFREFIMAWIQRLQAQKKVRYEAPPPYGWVTKNGVHDGFAIGGRVYDTHGAHYNATGADATLATKFTPVGKLSLWQESAKLVCDNRPDLQLLVAASFAAPLMAFTGTNGLAVSAIGATGTAKSSAMVVAQCIWSAPSIMSAMNDTPKSTGAKLAEFRSLPTLWDEVRVKEDDATAFVDAIYRVVQGQEMGRLNANVTQREVRNWQTIMIMAANRPLMDYMQRANPHVESGAVRLLEYEVAPVTYQMDARAMVKVAQAKSNYGHAGIIYAQYLAKHYDRLKEVVIKVMAEVIAAVGSTTEERFFVAGIATIIVGAKIADRELGLMKFDHPALRKLLYATFLSSREARGKVSIMSAAGMDVSQVMAAFMAASNANRLVTTCFNSARGTGFRVLHTPLTRKVDVQIAVEDKLLRINRLAFDEFIVGLALANTVVFSWMHRTWGAVEVRRVLGGGTPMSVNQTRVIEISLTHADLAAYLDVTPEHGPAKPSPAQALRAPPLPAV